MKLVYSERKGGTSKQVELDDSAMALLINRKIGEVVEGDTIGVPGVRLRITGGSDGNGFPMIKNIEGSRKLSVLKTMKNSKNRGEKKRQTVVGNTINAGTAQVNAVALEAGEEAEGKKEEVGKR